MASRRASRRSFCLRRNGFNLESSFLAWGLSRMELTVAGTLPRAGALGAGTDLTVVLGFKMGLAFAAGFALAEPWPSRSPSVWRRVGKPSSRGLALGRHLGGALGGRSGGTLLRLGSRFWFGLRHGWWPGGKRGGHIAVDIPPRKRKSGNVCIRENRPCSGARAGISSQGEIPQHPRQQQRQTAAAPSSARPVQGDSCGRIRTRAGTLATRMTARIHMKKKRNAPR